MNAAQKNNNPINLDFAGQPGAVADGRFAKFDAPGTAGRPHTGR